uniref:Uncharacterized protein n=1 Tax=Ciona intestinalis TaxID=7719 RepID=H2XNZ5_CIOIN
MNVTCFIFAWRDNDSCNKTGVLFHTDHHYTSRRRITLNIILSPLKSHCTIEKCIFVKYMNK